MTCKNAKELTKIGELMDNARSYGEWEELNEVAEELCKKVANCSTKCGNNACYGLQNSDAIELDFEESQYY